MHQQFSQLQWGGIVGRDRKGIQDRVQEFENEGMYVFDAVQKIMMCAPCNVRVSWNRKSSIDSHCTSNEHVKAKPIWIASQNRKRQASISTSFETAKKAKEDREEFIEDTVKTFMKCNIPLEKFDHPDLRKWLNNRVKGN